MASRLALILPEYFATTANYIEMLDPGNVKKQSARLYLYVDMRHHACYVPLRKRIDLTIGNIGYPVPSSTKPQAGLDFRKVLIIDNPNYIKRLHRPDLSANQTKTMITEYVAIKTAFGRYVSGYIKAVNKGREGLDRLYKYSTLHNFHEALGLL